MRSSHSSKINRSSGRKSWWIGVAALLLVGLAALFAVQLARQSAAGISPRLVVDQEEIDLGERRYGERVTARFELTNAGEQVLRIREAPSITVQEGC